MIELMHTFGPRTTDISKTEGRLRQSIGSLKNKKRKLLKKYIGKGGCGTKKY